MTFEPGELEVDELVLRIPVISDAADALLMLSDPEVRKWHPAPEVVDLQSSEQWCRRGADWASGQHATFTVVDRATDRLVGNVSLGNIDLDDQREASIAYRIAPWARRRRVATRAVDAVSCWAFLDLGVERIALEHRVENIASCRVAQAGGYPFEAVKRGGYRDDHGDRHDAHLHARLATDDP